MEIPKALSEKVAYHKQRSHRIEALADGVFAIAMTLLVLDIRIPIDEMNTEKSMWLSLVHTLPKILTFVLSFSGAGLFWSVFINQFNYIHTSDRNENNNCHIFFTVCFVTFIFHFFLSGHLWSRVAISFYIFNIISILIINTLHWLYSYRAGLVQAEGHQEAIIHKAIMRRAELHLHLMV